MRHLDVRPVIVSALLAVSAGAQQPKEIPLWPGEVPGEAGRFTEKEIADGRAKNDANYVRFCTTPTLTPYPAAPDKATGTAVVVCPGGGYHVLAWRKEGVKVAQWLQGLGVSAYVLKYRVPRRDKTTPHVAPLQDAQRALRIVRSRAKEWKLDPRRIGILGFSAGGHLTVMTAVQHQEKTYPRVDAIDDVSARPDFMIPVYAAYLGAKDDPTRLDPRVKVTKKTPPMFTVVTHDDKLRGLHAALLFAELKKHRVPAELHVYGKGGHGYGLGRPEQRVNAWPTLCEGWLRERGLLAK